MAKITFTQDQIERSYKIVDEGLYYVKLTSFRQKHSKNAVFANGAWDNYNLNPQLEITRCGDGSAAPTKDDGKPVPIFYNLNTKAPWIMVDFTHMFGIPHEDLGGGNYQMPGIWTPEAEPDLEKCEYKGPLINKEGLLYLVKTTYNGNDQNKPKYFQCAIKDCAQRWPKIHASHVKDLLKVKAK